MKLLILSDLHLGFGKTDLFKHSDKEFINMLEASLADKIVLAGDVLDIWRFPKFMIKRKHYELIDYIRKSNIVYLKGNHDITEFQPNSIVIDRILIEHGHAEEMQYMNKYTIFFTQLGLRLLAMFEEGLAFSFSDFYMKKVEPLRDKILNWVVADLKRFALKKYGKVILEKRDMTDLITFEINRAVKQNCDIVVCGHTHDLFIQSGKVTFVNSGECYDSFQGVLLDTSKRTIKTFKNFEELWK